MLSVLAPDAVGTPYDRHAAGYDRLVGSRRYNRVVWGADTATYTAFAAESLGDGDGALLDIGCGTAVFTADVYRESDRPLVLLDRSVGMLERASERLGLPLDGRVVLLQADVFDLPFRPHSFSTVACHGLLHLFDDLPALLSALAGQVAPGGVLYASSLVAERALARRLLGVMHRTGEAAAPRRAADVADQARAVLGPVAARRQGAMLFLTNRR